DIVGKRAPGIPRLRSGSQLIHGDFVDRCPTSTAHAAPAGVDRDAPQPRLEAIDLAQARELAPCSQAAVLHCVPGVRLIADDRQSESKETVEPDADEGFECLPIAELRPP